MTGLSRQLTLSSVHGHDAGYVVGIWVDGNSSINQRRFDAQNKSNTIRRVNLKQVLFCFRLVAIVHRKVRIHKPLI